MFMGLLHLALICDFRLIAISNHHRSKKMLVQCCVFNFLKCSIARWPGFTYRRDSSLFYLLIFKKCNLLGGIRNTSVWMFGTYTMVCESRWASLGPSNLCNIEEESRPSQQVNHIMDNIPKMNYPQHWLHYMNFTSASSF